MPTMDTMTKTILVKSKNEAKIMKKYFILFSAALLSLAACNKEIVEPIADNETDVVLTFTSERPQLDADTRTAWDSETSSIVWAEGDKIRVGYTIDGDWMGQTEAGEAKFYYSKEVVINDTNASVGEFNVPITGGGTTAFTDPEIEGKYVFYALYPGSLLSDTKVATAPDVPVTLKSNQTPTAESFDGATDIMVAKTAEMDLGGLPTDPIELMWDRVVAHGYFTLKDLQGVVDGETVTKVTLTAQENAALAGDISVSLEDGSFTASDATNEIVVNGADLAFVKEDGKTNLKIWLSALPETLTALTVDLETNKAHYVREIPGISKTLKRNARNVLAINMSTATRTAIAEVVWVKKNITAITSSDVFVIVGNNGANYAMTNDNGTSSAPAVASVTVSGDKLSSSPADNIQWTLSASEGSYTFYPNGSTDKWLYCTSSNNGVRVGTNDNKAFTIDQGYLKNTATSRYVGIYNSQDWRCYTLSSGSIASNIAGQTFSFFVKTAAGDVKETPTITFPELSTTVEIGETVSNVATIDPEGLEITYSSDDEDIATVDASTGEVTGIAAGTATITASFAGNDNYEATSESYTITVIDPDNTSGTEENPYTVSEAIDVINTLESNVKPENEVYVTGTISRVQSYNSTYKSITYYISDDGTTDKQLQVYSGKGLDGADFSELNELAVGDQVVVKGYLYNYNGSTPEIYQTSQIVSIEKVARYTVTLSTAANGTISASSTNVAAGVVITLTATPASGYELDSWAVTNDSTGDAVTVTGSTFTMPESNVTVTATFKEISGTVDYYALYSGDLTEGDYVIVYNGKAMKNTVANNRFGYQEVTVSSDNKISNPDDAIVWHIAKSGDYWTIYNAAVTKYAAGNGTKNQGALADSGTDDGSLWTASGNGTYEFVNKKNAAAGVNANLRNNGTYGFACYGTGTGGALSLYKLN